MKNDVFLNFRGVDIRKTFISHLFSSLKKKDITAFPFYEPCSFDLRDIKESVVAITVISKNASLDWWVYEVAEIIKCEKIGTLKTVPVFFQVDPYDVIEWFNRTKKHTKMEATQREKLDMVKKWLDVHLTNKSCFNSSDCKDDSELVDKITLCVSDILISSPSSYHSSDLTPVDLGTSSILPPVGSPLFMTTIDSSANLAYNKLSLHELGALLLRILSPVVGICGREGVGKTSLARHVSEEISHQFQHNFYKTNFSIQRQESSYIPGSLVNFACKSLKESNFHGSSDDAIKEIIGRRKVLIVVDGVDDIQDLRGIIKDASRFGPGSRFIVITQERSMLTQCGVKHIYELECPMYEEALALFSEFAFKQRNPLPGFEALSFRAVQVTNRLPLALKMLGTFLCDKEKDEWVSTLRRLEASHDNSATKVLRYIGADDYSPRLSIKVDRHIRVDEANRFPFYRFALK